MGLGLQSDNSAGPIMANTKENLSPVWDLSIWTGGTKFTLLSSLKVKLVLPFEGPPGHDQSVGLVIGLLVYPDLLP